MTDAVKFIHASDFHLERPIRGLADVPAHLKGVLAGAAYSAAERVFDLAIRERVDFLLLAGDIGDLELGSSRAAAFLLNQFERLAARRIAVYWCGGQVDQPDHWPSAIPLPDNVVVFSSTSVDCRTHLRDSRPVATILGTGFDGRPRSGLAFDPRDDAPFAIALVHGDVDTATIAQRGVRYWAGGGKHIRHVVEKADSLIIWPGTIQGRGLDEAIAGGVTLVRVDTSGRATAQHVEVDAVRWREERLAIAESAGIDDLKKLMADRILEMKIAAPEQLVLVRWTIEPTGPFARRLRSAEFERELLSWSRQQFGSSAPGVWSSEIVVEAPAALPSEWFEEATVLGDYLRQAADWLGQRTALSLHQYVPDSIAADPLWDDLDRLAGAERDVVLRQCMLAGVEHLSGPDSSES
jgi:DNA repair exonuclease SbcCD nuclease subunit